MALFSSRKFIGKNSRWESKPASKEAEHIRFPKRTFVPELARRNRAPLEIMFVKFYITSKGAPPNILDISNRAEPILL